MDVQSKTYNLSGKDPEAVLRFSARFITAWNYSVASGGGAVWKFQFYLTGQAHAVL